MHLACQEVTWIIFGRSCTIQATQSSISRDLEDLGAVRYRGLYRLDAWKGFQRSPELLRDFAYALLAENAGHALTVLTTDPGAGKLVAAAIRRAKWPEVVGVLADESTVFVATGDFNAQKLLFRRIRILLRESARFRPVSRTFEAREETRLLDFAKAAQASEDEGSDDE
jgi:arginine repressor